MSRTSVSGSCMAFGASCMNRNNGERNLPCVGIADFLCHPGIMGADEFRPCGDHWVRLEDDLVVLRVKGVVTLADMAEFMRLQAQVKRERGRVFALYDSREN